MKTRTMNLGLKMYLSQIYSEIFLYDIRFMIYGKASGKNEEDFMKIDFFFLHYKAANLLLNQLYKYIYIYIYTEIIEII